MRNLPTVAKAAGLMLVLAFSHTAMAAPAQNGQSGAMKAKLEQARLEAMENARKFFPDLETDRKEKETRKVGHSETKAKKKAGRSFPDWTKLARRNAAPVKKAHGGSASLNAIIARHAAAEGVPLDLAHAVIRIESNYNAKVTGRAGEVGLMQIKPRTARGMGYVGSTKALYTPENNIRYGMKYLGKAYKLGGGDICGAILRYNAGHYARRMNKTSSAYCSKVKRYMAAS